VPHTWESVPPRLRLRNEFGIRIFENDDLTSNVESAPLNRRPWTILDRRCLQQSLPFLEPSLIAAKISATSTSKLQGLIPTSRATAAASQHFTMHNQDQSSRSRLRPTLRRRRGQRQRSPRLAPIDGLLRIAAMLLLLFPLSPFACIYSHGKKARPAMSPLLCLLTHQAFSFNHHQPFRIGIPLLIVVQPCANDKVEDGATGGSSIVRTTRLCRDGRRSCPCPPLRQSRTEAATLTSWYAVSSYPRRLYQIAGPAHHRHAMLSYLCQWAWVVALPSCVLTDFAP
jgi:hypothetical protein